MALLPARRLPAKDTPLSEGALRYAIRKDELPLTNPAGMVIAKRYRPALPRRLGYLYGVTAGA